MTGRARSPTVWVEALAAMAIDSKLFRLTCSVDGVLAAATADDAERYALAHRHRVHVEQLAGPEALVGLDPQEAVLVLAALRRVQELNGRLGADADAVAALVERIGQALALLEDQAVLTGRAPTDT